MTYSSSLAGVPIIAWVLTALLLLFAVVSTLAGRGTIGRNPYLGIRIPSLFASDEAWRRGHAAAVRPSWLGFVVALAADLAGLLAQPAYLVTVAVFVAVLIWTLIAAGRAARSA